MNTPSIVIVTVMFHYELLMLLYVFLSGASSWLSTQLLPIDPSSVALKLSDVSDHMGGSSGAVSNRLTLCSDIKMCSICACQPSKI